MSHRVELTLALRVDESDPIEPRPVIKVPSVAFRDSRVFVPLAYTGCGVGCKYCYISAPSEAARPLPPVHVKRLLRQVGERIARTQRDDLIMAIGSDTEIGVSPDIVNNVVTCLEFAAKHGLAVQIATKFPLPAVLRDALESWPLRNTPPVIFTTITTLAISSRIEPNAPSPVERAKNFSVRRTAWQSYALVKPFLPTSQEDKNSLLELLAASRPDGVVVGVRYRRRHSAADRGDPHPVAGDWIATLPSEPARIFVRQLDDLGLRVFMNTQCASSWHDLRLDSTIVRDKYPHLCVRCGRCPEEVSVEK